MTACPGLNYETDHASDRSRHSGFAASMIATFFARLQPLICFSRAIAAEMSDVTST